MRIPCDRCGRTGNEDVPVFFAWPPASAIQKQIPDWMFGIKPGYSDEPILIPIDEVTPKRRTAISNILGLVRPCEVHCATCISLGIPQLWQRKETRRMLRSLVEQSLCSMVDPLDRLMECLTPSERDALYGARGAAYEEGLQEAMRRDSRNQVRDKKDKKYIPRKPEPLRGRRRPPRDKLRHYARLLDQAVQRHHSGKESKQQRCRRILPLLTELNMYLSLGRVNGRQYHLPPDDPRLVERVRKML
jgi:hypothetical protein